MKDLDAAPRAQEMDEVQTEKIGAEPTGTGREKGLAMLQGLDRFFASLNYSYGLRMIVGIALAWFVAFRLQTDKPYWAIMTVMIVTLPTQSELLEKFIARLIGTVVGAISVNIIAAYALDDQWLFVIYMAFWLALCAYLASARSSMLTYCFSLCGYTSAILGFSLSVIPSSYMVFQISQARILEIWIGLVTAFFISMLWPAYLEHRDIRHKLRAKRFKVRELYEMLLTPGQDHKAFAMQYKSTLQDLMDFRDRVFQSFLSVSTERNEVLSIYQNGHRLITAMSGVLSLESMKHDLLKSDREAMIDYLDRLREWFLKGQSRERKLATKPVAPDALLSSSKGRYFVKQLDDKLMDLLALRAPDTDRADLYIPSIRIYYSDRKEALINGARTFLSIIAGMAFWMGTQWETGYILLVLIGLICTLGATYPMINKLLTVTLVLTIFMTVPVAYMLKFGVLIKANGLLPAMLIVLPIYFFAAMIKIRSLIGFLIGYAFMLSSVFLIGFANPMTYNFAQFANNALSVVIALVIILMIFNIIRPSSDDRKIERILESINHQFTLVEKNVTPKAVRDYEAYLYSAIYKARIIPESYGKARFLSYAFLTLVILRQQLALSNNEVRWALPDALQTAIQYEQFEEALSLIPEYEKNAHNDAERMNYWELSAAIRALLVFLDHHQSNFADQ
ncbi:MAG: FUSC family protein [Xanthomonadaceae bacterium]|nr:FUSC family protein [Xanthomonadaceae bacterium]